MAVPEAGAGFRRSSRKLGILEVNALKSLRRECQVKRSDLAIVVAVAEHARLVQRKRLRTGGDSTASYRLRPLGEGYTNHVYMRWSRDLHQLIEPCCNTIIRVLDTVALASYMLHKRQVWRGCFVSQSQLGLELGLGSSFSFHSTSRRQRVTWTTLALYLSRLAFDDLYA